MKYFLLLNLTALNISFTIVSIICALITVLLTFLNYLDKKRNGKSKKIEKWNQELNIKHNKFQEYINSQKEKQREIGKGYDKWIRDEVLKNHLISILKNERDTKKIKIMICSRCGNTIKIQNLIESLEKNSQFKINYEFSFQDLKFFYIDDKKLQHSICFWEYLNCEYRKAKIK